MTQLLISPARAGISTPIYERRELFDRNGELHHVEIWVGDKHVASWGADFDKKVKTHPVMLAHLEANGVTL